MPAYVRKTVSKTYFIGELFIPHLLGSSAAATSVVSNLDWFVDKYEPKYLELLMGSTLYAAYVAGLNVTAPPATRWTALEALIFDSTNLISPVANYVYFFYIRNDRTFTTSNAETQGTQENATIKTNNHKVTTAWNEMVDKTEELQQWLMDNIATYPEFLSSEITTFDKINAWGI